MVAPLPAMKWIPSDGVQQAAPGTREPSASQLQAVDVDVHSAPKVPSTCQAGQLPVSVEPLPKEGQPAANGDHPPAELGASQPAPQGNAPAGSALTFEAAVERVEGVLRRLTLEHDKGGFFQDRVSTDLRGCENYYERIKHPMWFSRIREKVSLQESRCVYHTQLL